MDLYGFRVGESFKWNDEIFEIQAVLPDGYLQIYSVDIHQSKLEKTEDLDKAYVAKELSFLPKYQTPEIMKGDQPYYRDRAFNDFEEWKQDVARWRLFVITPLLEKKRPTNSDVEARVEEARAMLTPEQKESPWYQLSKTTVNRWRRRYRETDDIRSLIPRTEDRGGPDQLRIEDEVDAILRVTIKEMVIEAKLPDTIEHVWLEARERVKDENKRREVAGLALLTPAHRSTVARRIEKMKEEKSLRNAQKEPHPSRRHQRPHRRHLKANQESEIDTTEIDVIAVDDDRTVPIGRMTFVSEIDAGTGYPRGYYIGFEPESHYATMECMYHAAMPKIGVREKYGTQHDWFAQGLTSLIRFDRGRGYKNKHLEDALISLEIEADILPPRTPFFKPFVERNFRTTNDGLFHLVDGTTFSNFIKRGDYDSLQLAALTCFEIEQLLHIYMLDEVAERPLRGIGGITRASKWHELTKPPFVFKKPAGAKELMIALGWVEERIVQPNHGFEIDYIRYYHKEMNQYLCNVYGKQKAKIKRHPGQLSEVYVFDPETKNYVGPIPAVDQEYTLGLSAWMHRIILEYQREVRGSIEPSQFAEARRAMGQIMQQARQQRLGVRQQERAQRFFSSPPSLSSQSESEASAQQATINSGARPINKVKPESLILDPERAKQMRIIEPKPRKIRLDPKE